MCNIKTFFVKLGERQSHLLARKNTPVDIRKGDVEACFPDTLNPGGGVRGCSVGCMLGMSDVSSFVFIAAATMVHGISRTKEMLFQAGVLGAAEFSGVLIGTTSLFCFRCILSQFER